MDFGENEAERLRREQQSREERERLMSETSGEPAEAETHSRRAAKAAYLKAKLEEREQSEAEAKGEDAGP